MVAGAVDQLAGTIPWRVPWISSTLTQQVTLPPDKLDGSHDGGWASGKSVPSASAFSQQVYSTE